jgi:hypothetical protein
MVSFFCKLLQLNNLERYFYEFYPIFRIGKKLLTKMVFSSFKNKKGGIIRLSDG